MAHDVIMPALGMTQDTGIIVTWHKQPGDTVSADDILAEVETDKTTMEIEVGYDGFLASINADTGIPDPVGEIIAIIAETKEEAGAVSQIPSSPEPRKEDVDAPTAIVLDPDSTLSASNSPSMVSPTPPPTAHRLIPSNGRILASPKTRRLARERGIALQNLVNQGLPQPYHVADLDKVQSITLAAVYEIGARVDATSFASFHHWVEAQTDSALPPNRIWAAITAACFRAVTGSHCASTLCVCVTSLGPGGERLIMKDLDQTGLLTTLNGADDGEVHLTVIDLSATPLFTFRSGGGADMPTLIIAKTGDGDGFELRLQYLAGQLPEKAAFDFLTGVVERAQDPLRQLL